MLLGASLFINMIAWGYFVVTGISGYRYIISQGAIGYPNLSQTILYICVPSLMAAFAVMNYILAVKLERRRSIFATFAILSIFSTIPYMIISRGGV